MAIARVVVLREESGHGPGAPHSPWELLEHMRIAQSDILEYSRDAAHVSPEFPKGYWPASPEPPGETAWDESVAKFRADRAALSALVNDESLDLFAKIPRGTAVARPTSPRRRSQHLPPRTTRPRASHAHGRVSRRNGRYALLHADVRLDLVGVDSGG